MEMGSSSSSSNSSDSLNGLKFGQKIYFEDVGVGLPAPAKYAGGGGGSGSLTPPKKGRASVVQAGQPPRCQVEGCKVDLTDAKAYYSRHKVCGMHSKSPMVIVSGLEQRFCQQCSRFHQLPEFDQGKRSCRRRLAGHNERRRKPPPGSLLSSRFGRLSSSIFGTEGNSRSGGGGFVMDFTTYPRHTNNGGRDSWLPTITRAPSSEWEVPSAGGGKFLPQQPWSENPPPPTDHHLYHLPGGGYNGIHSGECFTGGVSSSDSGCALSLLSNQQQQQQPPWGGSRNHHRPSSLGVGVGAVNNNNMMMNPEGASSVGIHPTSAPSSSAGAGAGALTHFSNIPWGCFKGNESCCCSHEMPPPDLGLGQISESSNNGSGGHYSSTSELELDLATQNGRQFMELDLSRAYDPSSAQHHMNWSL